MRLIKDFLQKEMNAIAGGHNKNKIINCPLVVRMWIFVSILNNALILINYNLFFSHFSKQLLQKKSSNSMKLCKKRFNEEKWSTKCEKKFNGASFIVFSFILISPSSRHCFFPIPTDLPGLINFKSINSHL